MLGQWTNFDILTLKVAIHKKMEVIFYSLEDYKFRKPPLLFILQYVAIALLQLSHNLLV
jgi:hypothetical protein